MKKIGLLGCLALFISQFVSAQNSAHPLCKNVVGVCLPSEDVSKDYVFDKQLYTNRTDTFPQVIFWRRVMNLEKDSAVINIYQNRQILNIVHNKTWQHLSDTQLKYYKDTLKVLYNLPDTTKILITTGKKYFYDFNNTSQHFDKGIKAFIDNNVDPWYCQAILLIESPNKLQKSNVGAYGPFQLMKGVAQLFGLKVNKYVDERADFERSAFAASSLIKKVCIPKTKEMLSAYSIPFDEHDLWFKLLVMHSYHAGAGNVRAVINAIAPQKGGLELIQKMWQTKAASFGIASQNYSQLILAAMLEMNERIGDNIHLFQ